MAVAAGAASGPAARAVGYEQLWQQAPCAHLLLDHDSRILDVNDTFTSWTGHQREMLVGAAFTMLLPVGDRILFSTHCVPQLGIAGRVSEVSVHVTGADGRRHAALLSAVRAPTGAGGPTAGVVQVVLFSASERRRYEQDLLAARRRAEASEARIAATEADLKHQILHDPLTGLLNRSGLLQHLHAWLAHHRDRTPRPAAHVAAEEATALEVAVPVIFFIDLDGFKTVNDSLGHAAGDELLSIVAARLTSVVRAGAILARLAGDEFAVMDQLTAHHAATLAQRLLDVLAGPVVLHGVEVVISASIGVASAPDSDPASSPASSLAVVPGSDLVAAGEEHAAELLLRRADAAMYRAKASGRARWQMHHPDCGDPTADRLLLLEQLRHAITHGQLRLHYQPRIALGSGRLDGVEALVRWAHPTRGLLPPSEFITAAEDSGLIRDLGAWVIEEAIAQAVRWDADPTTPRLRMAVNLSTRQLADPHLLSHVASTLARHGLKASRLTLEITETALMSQPATALETLTALKGLGIGLAVDDFGTGYSSLTYLKRFPVDELKIDQSFVAGITTDPGDHAIVASCIHLAHAMGLTAVAEGVETPEQLHALTHLGADLAQGYYYGPQPPAPTTLARRSRPTPSVTPREIVDLRAARGGAPVCS